jgi:hypothetical protein
MRSEAERGAGGGAKHAIRTKRNYIGGGGRATPAILGSAQQLPKMAGDLRGSSLLRRIYSDGNIFHWQPTNRTLFI